MNHTYEPFWTHAMALVTGAALMVIFLTGREPPETSGTAADQQREPTPHEVCPRTLRKMT
jgi:hypothetical protein